MSRETGRFSDGLLLGLLLGGAIVFLLGTEKGKKVLKLLTSEGGMVLENILTELDGVDSKSKQVEHHTKKRVIQEPEVVDAKELNFSEYPVRNGHAEDSEKRSRAVHRFFKGTKPL